MFVIDHHFKRSAHDPGSIDSENCTVPVLTEGCWKTSCIVRGKNAFGAMVANQYTCLLMEGGVLGHTVLGCE
jgi:hypothetical protein